MSFRIFFVVVLSWLTNLSEVAYSQSPLNSNSTQLPSPQKISPSDYKITGDVLYGDLNTLGREQAGWGVRLLAGSDRNGDQFSEGQVSTVVRKLTAKTGRWYQLRIHGMALPGFHVEKEALFLKVEFSKDNGETPLDHIKQTFYAQVEQDRADLKDPGTNKKLGSATWRNYALDFRTPFPDNVVITVTEEHLVIKSKNLPNHPTAKFPDRWRALDGNPNYIAEQRATWYLPLKPQNSLHKKAMQDRNNNDHALPMGPIGIATNGLVFFNPFDHLLDEDAVWRLDRCCGHPSPRDQYHYHKYPVCIKSPWADDGADHSPVIGFAFDGFPVYGPYESECVLAKELTRNKLNDYNIHYDGERGWHYHVTPGKFPHIIGGYWGVADPKINEGVADRRAPAKGPLPALAGHVPRDKPLES